MGPVTACHHVGHRPPSPPTSLASPSSRTGAVERHACPAHCPPAGRPRLRTPPDASEANIHRPATAGMAYRATRGQPDPRQARHLGSQQPVDSIPCVASIRRPKKPRLSTLGARFRRARARRWLSGMASFGPPRTLISPPLSQQAGPLGSQ